MSETANRRTNGPARMVLSPDEGETVWLRKLGIRFMIGEEETGGNFALVEHPIEPRALAAPMHTHQHEDEYTYVLEGEIGVQDGDEVRVALVFKPRGVPHAFWNAGEEPARAFWRSSPPPGSSSTSRRRPLCSSRPSRPARRAGARRGNGPGTGWR